MRFSNRLRAAACAAGACLAAPALAVDAQIVVIPNDTGATAARLTVQFSGAAAALTVDPATVVTFNCPGPPPVAVSPVDLVDIDWGVDCVAPLQTAAFLAVTPNGPLGVTNYCWWDAAGNLLGCGSVQARLFPFAIGPGGGGGGGGPLVKKRVKTWQHKCIPTGPTKRTPWYWFVGGQCWWRYTCQPKVNYWSRLMVHCAFSRGNLVLWTTRPRAVTPWFRSGMADPRYFWERRTLRPQGPIKIIRGPHPKRNPPMDPNLFDDWQEEFEGNAVGDNGQGAQQSTNFSIAFQRMANALAITLPVDPAADLEPNDPRHPSDPNYPLPDLGPLPNSLQALSPRYEAAAGELAPLLDELAQAISDGPGDPNFIPQLPQMAGAVQTIQNGLGQMSAVFALGDAGPPTLYLNMEFAATDLAGALRTLDRGPAGRWESAAAELDEMAVSFNIAGGAVLNGLDDPNEIDAYMWALLQGFEPSAQHFAQAMAPHVALQIDLGDPNQYQWGPAEVPFVEVQVQDADSGVVLGQWSRTISNLGRVFVPLTEDGAAFNIRYKLPSHLAVVVPAPAEDGYVAPAVPLVNGDVNNDNCVDPVDVQLVELSLGAGGPPAGFYPPSDLNADGFVDEVDLGIATAALGQCGAALDLPCPGDADGDADVDLNDLLLLLGNFGAVGSGVPGDVDGNGVVDLNDLLRLLANFGAVCR